MEFTSCEMCIYGVKENDCLLPDCKFRPRPLYEAAPELYEACLSALGVLSLDNIAEHPKMIESAKETVRQAIAKAEGK